MKACIQCNKDFKPISYKHIFCSPKCREDYTFNTKVGNTFLIFKRDNFRCAYCGATPMDDGVQLSLDHIVPKTKGGSHTAGNLITACKKCNSAKSNTQLPVESLEYFLEYTMKSNEKSNIPQDRVIEGSHTKGYMP